MSGHYDTWEAYLVKWLSYRISIAVYGLEGATLCRSGLKTSRRS